MKIINTEALFDLVGSGPLALFDVRGDVEYEEGHIPGAKTAPLGSLVFRVAGTMKPDSLVIVYSGGGICSLAAQAAQRLAGLRMTNVYVYADGIAGWEEAGHDVVESPHARVHARGPVIDVRPIVINRERDYNGAFAGKPTAVEGAGG
ncbi:MAG: rhodanese-like domain-containing protein [Deltaproteobacteria bacterium]|nr:rhodanese-like domain-containing protein [Deltaproteobacteria bacterium]